MSDAVEREQVVARTELPGSVSTVNVVNRHAQGGRRPREQGGADHRDAALIRWFKTTVGSPIVGTLDAISHVTGQVLLREPPSCRWRC